MSGGAGAKLAEFVSQLRRPLGEMPAELEMCPVKQAFDVVVRPPGSKSLTNRALLLAGFSRGESMLHNCLLDADDAKVMIAALRQLGADVVVEDEAGGSVRVNGVAGRARGGVTLNLNNAGTATRFLTAVACLADAPVVIDGNARMRKRPIGELVSMLRAVGVKVVELGEPGCVPLRIHPCRPEGGVLEIGRTQSSQYISAMMLLAPWTERGIEFVFHAPATSSSYIWMTLDLLRESGVDQVEADKDLARAFVRASPGAGCKGSNYRIESDASGASYFWGAASVVAGAQCAIDGLLSPSAQGDAGFYGVLLRMGASVGGRVVSQDAGSIYSEGPPNALRGERLRGIDVDLGSMPDTAMTAAAVACFASGPTTLRGLRTLRVKETDRLAAVQKELGKIGVTVEIESYVGEGGVQDELMRITPPVGGVECSDSAPRVVFDTYDDHRMAMSLALIGLRRPNVVIRDPGCVAKTYPGFWADWAGLYWERV